MSPASRRRSGAAGTGRSIPSTSSPPPARRIASGRGTRTSAGTGRTRRRRRGWRRRRRGRRRGPRHARPRPRPRPRLHARGERQARCRVEADAVVGVDEVEADRGVADEDLALLPNPDRQSNALIGRIGQAWQRLPEGSCRTITFDRGTEFAAYAFLGPGDRHPSLFLRSPQPLAERCGGERERSDPPVSAGQSQLDRARR